MICKKCGQTFDDNFNNCPNCGESVNDKKKKSKKPIFKKWWFWLIIIILIIGIIGTAGDNSDTSSTTDKNEEKTTYEQELNETTSTETISEEATNEPSTEATDYRENCISVGYKDIARMPDNYKGMDIFFSGQVMQVMESSFSNSVTYRIGVTQDEYGFWDDVVYVTYKLPEGAPRILEEDIVTFYGVCQGTYTYSAVLGNNITIPSVDAKIIDIIS